MLYEFAFWHNKTKIWSKHISARDKVQILEILDYVNAFYEKITDNPNFEFLINMDQPHLELIADWLAKQINEEDLKLIDIAMKNKIYHDIIKEKIDTPFKGLIWEFLYKIRKSKKVQKENNQFTIGRAKSTKTK